MTVRARLSAASAPCGVLVLGALAVGAVTACAAPARAETLADAVAMAYQTNPTLGAERVNLRFLEETYVQALANLRPTVSGIVQAQTQRAGAHIINNVFGAQPVGADEDSTGTAALQFSQPVYTGGRATAAIQGAEADVRAERETLRQTEADVLQQVIKSYVDVRRDEQAIAIRIENVSVLQRQVNESRTRFEVGEVTRTDVAQSESDLAQAQAALATAQAQLAIDRATYAQIVGQSPTDLAPEPALRLPATIDKAFDQAQEYNPTIRAADYTLQGAGARIKEAKDGHLPTVSINGEVGFQGGPITPIHRPDYWTFSQATITLTQPIFNGGQTESAIRQAIERQNYYTIQLEARRRDIVQSLSSAWNQLLSARANIAADEERVRAAGVAVEGARAEQAVGLRTTLEVLTAEQNLRDAQLDLVSARHDEYVSSAQVLNATGELSAGNIVADLPLQPAGHSFERLQKSVGYVPWQGLVKDLDMVAGKTNIRELAPNPDEPIITASPGQGADVGAHGPAEKVVTSAAPAASSPSAPSLANPALAVPPPSAQATPAIGPQPQQPPQPTPNIPK